VASIALPRVRPPRILAPEVDPFKGGRSDPARIKKTPAHSSSSGRDNRNTLQKRKKWATGSPIARAHEGSMAADVADAITPRATTVRSTTDNRKPGENVATGTPPPLSLTVRDQRLAAKDCPTPATMPASPLHRLVRRLAHSQSSNRHPTKNREYRCNTNPATGT